MAFVTAPDFPIRSVQWSLDSPSQSNVSTWTGTRTVVSDPWHSKWRAHVELASQQGEENFRLLRSFFVKLKGSTNIFRLYATAGAQNSNTDVSLVSDAAAASNSITITGTLQALSEGQYFTINGQLCCCTADQTVGGVLAFEPKLRVAALAGTTVVTSRPYALVYLADSKFGYAVETWRQFSSSFDVEEAILETDGSVPETSTPSAPVYPLDGAGAMPLFAYSTRKLTAAWTGACFEVVKASGGSPVDIGFVGQNLDISALDAFLGSDLGHITKWYDQSGHGNHATQTTDANRPLVENGSVEGGPVLFKDKRPLIFDAKHMDLPIGITANRNSVNVFIAAETLRGPETLGSFIQLGSGANQFAVFQNTVQFNASEMPSLGKPIEQRPALYEVIGDGTTGTISQDFDSATGAITAASLAGGMIGNLDITTGYDLKAYVCAVIGYGRVLSSGEAAVIRTAMRTLFNLVTVPNSGRVIAVGDSIVVASDGTAYEYGFMKMAQRSLPNDIAFYNMGVGGAELGSGGSPKLATYATDGAGYILPDYTDNRVVFMMYGTNDITASGRTAAQVYADLQTYAGYVRADGGKIIVTTILPRASWDSAHQTTWNTLNANLRANWASWADGLCDFASDPTMGPFAAASDTLLYPDGIHPSRLGHTYLKPIALAALAALL